MAAVPRAAAQRPADRGRRRHGRAASRAPSPRLRCPEEANLRAPESVVAVHASFIRAGAELIETNTFGANRRKLAAQLPRGRVRARSTAPASSSRARRARSRAATSSSPARSARSASSRSSDASARELFAEQAAVLDGRGVDLFMVETFFDLDELVDRDRGRPRASRRLPIVALLTFDEDAETLGGVTAAEAAERLRRARRGRDRHEPRRRPARRADRARGDAATAACRSPRCRTSASRASPAAASSTRMRRPSTSPSSPRRRARSARGSIGGCCGTTPAQIAAIRAALDEEREPERAARRAASASCRARRSAHGAGRDRARARRSARASGSSASSSTRRRAARTTG